MAIDQRDVSSTLRFMDDRALQQYAAMHKNDPYIFPLAFQESQNRQKMRTSQQMQMAGQPQPKVADQALAQMAPQQAQPLPEDQGIGALAAPNMQTMADGGIAGYEGYDEGDSDFGQGPVMLMAEGGVARYQVGGSIESRYQQESQEMGMGTRMQYSPEVRAYAQAQEQASRDGYAERERQRMLRGPYADAAPTAPTTLAAPAAATPNRVTPTFSPDDYSGMDRRIMSGSQLPNIQSITPPAKPAPTGNREAAPRPDTKRVVADPSAARKDPAQATPDVMGMFDQALKKADEKPNPMETQLKAINAERVKAGEENVTGLEAIQKQFSDIYKGRKERLDTREGEIAKMKDQSLGLALLNAGAAMMSTRGSIGQVVGAGIDTGSKQYVAGLDKINAAKDKLSDARDRLEELESQRGELSARELHKARNEVKTLTVAGMENLVQAAMAERKLNRAEAVDFVKAQLTVSTADKDRASRENIAEIGERGANARSAAQIRATLSTPDKVMFDQAMANNGNDAFKAFEAVQQAKGEKFNLRTSYADYIKAFAGKDGLTPPMSIEQYAGKMGALLPR